MQLGDALVGLESQLGPPRGDRPRFFALAQVALVLAAPPRGVELLIVERARRAGDRWSGHLAFPGGLAARGDRGPDATARRETLEETGLDLARDARLLGALSRRFALGHRGGRPLFIEPFVYGVGGRPVPRLNAELHAAYFFPLAELAARRKSLSRWARTVGYFRPDFGHVVQGRRLWGLSLAMADELCSAWNKSDLILDG